MKKIIFICLLFSLITVFAAAEDNLRVALVVGNSNYPAEVYLKNPANDAVKMAELLRKAGFKVILKTNVSKKEFRGALREFEGSLGEGSVAFFYYAGHGLQHNQENYFLGIDSDIKAEFEIQDESVSLNTVLGAMKPGVSGLKIVLLDCCRTNPFERKFRNMGPVGLATVQPPESTVIGYATGPGRTAGDGEGENSYYAEALLKHLATPGQNLSDALIKVALSVYEATKRQQRPWRTDDMLEDFVLVPESSKNSLDKRPTKVKEQSIDVNDSIIERIILFPPFVQAGQSLQIKINTFSSRVRAFALFPSVSGKFNRVDAKWSRADGLMIDYPVSSSARPSRYKARLFVQEIDSNKESIREINYEVLDAEHSSNTPSPQDKERGELIPAAKPAESPAGLALKDQLGFKTIPSGTFTMGSMGRNVRYKKGEFELEQQAYNDEKPPHQLRVSSFSIMDHKLTGQDMKFLLKLQSNPTTFSERISGLTNIEAERELMPLAFTFPEALEVARQLSKMLSCKVRLPNEAEWEYAARGGLEGKDFPWGKADDIYKGKPVAKIVDAVLSVKDPGEEEHWRWLSNYPARSLAPENGFHLFDMAGGLWEWTSSRYLPYPYKADKTREPVDGFTFSADDDRVIRGGGRGHECSNIRVALRGYSSPGDSEAMYGVRYVIELGGALPTAVTTESKSDVKSKKKAATPGKN